MSWKVIFETEEYKFRGELCIHKKKAYFFNEAEPNKVFSTSYNDFDREWVHVVDLMMQGTPLTECESKIIKKQMYVDESGDLCIEKWRE